MSNGQTDLSKAAGTFRKVSFTLGRLSGRTREDDKDDKDDGKNSAPLSSSNPSR